MIRRLALLLLVVGMTACAEPSREDRARERAERELEAAREDLAEARDRLSEASDQVRERAQDLREETRDVVRDVDVQGLIGQVLEDVGRALKNEDGVQPVDFRKLGELLPEEIAGLEQVDVEGKTAGAFGIRVSHAKARYRAESGDAMEIAVIDLGSLQAAAEHGADWVDAHVDRESDDGWERTTELEGHPAHMKWHRYGSHGRFEATVFIADRFILHVEADGRRLPEDLMDEVLDGIPLDRVAGLAR